MEPTDLNRPAPDDAQLDSWLRSNATAAPLPDDGFSRRVLARLPPQADRAAATRRILLCLVGAVIGVVYAGAKGVSWSGLSADWSDFAPALDHNLEVLAEPSVLLALAVVAGSLLYVFGREKLQQTLE